MKRIKTHIPGFDKLIEGGLVEGSENLIVGSAGTGKTIFSLQYLYNGAKIEKETGIYFSFEEKRDDLINQAKQFGWNLEKLEKKGKIKIISLGFDDISQKTVDEIIEIVESLNAKRIVIDSISTLANLAPSPSSSNGLNSYEVKKFIYKFIAKLRDLKDSTHLLVTQDEENATNSVSKYLCDSIIKINYETLGGEFSRNLKIRKMRKTKNDEDLHPLEISNEGIKIHNL